MNQYDMLLIFMSEDYGTDSEEFHYSLQVHVLYKTKYAMGPNTPRG